VTVRFLGTSPQSSNALDLLASLYEQLKAISRGSAVYTKGDQDDADAFHGGDYDENAVFMGESLPECARSFEELSKALKAALKKWKWGPLTIFLDSVDQVFSTQCILFLAHTHFLSVSHKDSPRLKLAAM
jgi:hypothetical protein